MSELGKIVFYLCLAIPVITFLFCLIMGNNIGGAFDRGDYKIWIKEVIIGSTIYLSLLLYTLLNTAAIFVFNEILTSLIIYFILFTAIHFWNKYYK